MMTIKMTKNIEEANLITHSGLFHGDEVMATVILAKVFGNVKICRTFKVPENVPEETIVYDIGYGRFDHHQKEGNGVRENGVPFAACGLIWRAFGPQLVKNTVNPNMIFKLLDRDLIQGIDAVDCGVMPKTEYPAKPMSISQVISSFNPRWDTEEDSDEAFLRAVCFAEVVFNNVFTSACSKAKAENMVNEAIEASKDGIMVLNQFLPWQEYLLSSTSEKALEVKFIVFPSNRGGFNWQCVPDELGSFGQRKPVPTEWKGLRDDAIKQATGVATATFCHPAGFIGGAETLEDAIAIAKKAIES